MRLARIGVTPPLIAIRLIRVARRGVALAPTAVGLIRLARPGVALAAVSRLFVSGRRSGGSPSGVDPRRSGRGRVVDDLRVDRLDRRRPAIGAAADSCRHGLLVRVVTRGPAWCGRRRGEWRCWRGGRGWSHHDRRWRRRRWRVHPGWSGGPHPTADRRREVALGHPGACPHCPAGQPHLAPGQL